MQQQLMVPDQDTTYEENPSIHHGGMCAVEQKDGRVNNETEGQMDQAHFYIP